MINKLKQKTNICEVKTLSAVRIAKELKGCARDNDPSETIKETLSFIADIIDLKPEQERLISGLSPAELNKIKHAIEKGMAIASNSLLGTTHIKNKHKRTLHAVEKEIEFRRKNYEAVYSNLPLSTFLYLAPMLIDEDVDIIDHQYNIDDSGLDSYLNNFIERNHNLWVNAILMNLKEKEKTPFIDSTYNIKHGNHPELKALIRSNYLKDSGEVFLMFLLKKYSAGRISKKEMAEEIKSRIASEKQFFEKCGVNSVQISFLHQTKEMSEKRLAEHRKVSSEGYPLTLTSSSSKKSLGIEMSLKEKIVNHFNPLAPSLQIPEVKMSAVDLTGNLRVIGTTGSGQSRVGVVLSEYCIFNNKAGVFLLDSATHLLHEIYAKIMLAGRTHDIAYYSPDKHQDIDITSDIEENKIVIVNCNYDRYDRGDEKNEHCSKIIISALKQVANCNADLKGACVHVSDWNSIHQNFHKEKDVHNSIKAINEKNGCVLFASQNWHDDSDWFDDEFERLFKTTILMKSYSMPVHLKLKHATRQDIAGFGPGRAIIFSLGDDIYEHSHTIRYNDDYRECHNRILINYKED